MSLFVAIEGLDGSGQSTQTRLLRKWFLSMGEKCLATKEPTSGLIGGLIRAQLTGEWKSNPEALQLLFAADRAVHLDKDVLPALDSGIHVITDRYLFSSIAYGMVNLDEKWLKQINSQFRIPDITIYLKVSPEECFGRLKRGRSRLELFEREDYLKRVHENFMMLSREYKNFFIVDGEKSINEVHENIINLVKKLME
ncbi:MAG: dTMP kinase [Candidatus Diapherotrites archaeon]|nr:dTMP kinase [Candidatus Diapherotrites archaeon]